MMAAEVLTTPTAAEFTAAADVDGACLRLTRTQWRRRQRPQLVAALRARLAEETELRKAAVARAFIRSDDELECRLNLAAPAVAAGIAHQVAQQDDRIRRNVALHNFDIEAKCIARASRSELNTIQRTGRGRADDLEEKAAPALLIRQRQPDLEEHEEDNVEAPANEVGLFYSDFLAHFGCEEGICATCRAATASAEPGMCAEPCPEAAYEAFHISAVASVGPDTCAEPCPEAENEASQMRQLCDDNVHSVEPIDMSDRANFDICVGRSITCSPGCGCPAACAMQGQAGLVPFSRT